MNIKVILGISHVASPASFCCPKSRRCSMSFRLRTCVRARQGMSTRCAISPSLCNDQFSCFGRLPAADSLCADQSRAMVVANARAPGSHNMPLGHPCNCFLDTAKKISQLPVLDAYGVTRLLARHLQSLLTGVCANTHPSAQ